MKCMYNVHGYMDYRIRYVSYVFCRKKHNYFRQIRHKSDYVKVRATAPTHTHARLPGRSGKIRFCLVASTHDEYEERCVAGPSRQDTTPMLQQTTLQSYRRNATDTVCRAGLTVPVRPVCHYSALRHPAASLSATIFLTAH
jgi:hypothetical protein